MMLELEIGATNQAPKRRLQTLGSFLGLVLLSVISVSAVEMEKEKIRTTVPPAEDQPANAGQRLQVPEGWEHWEVERFEWSKRVKFTNLKTLESSSIKVHGTPLRRDSWLNLLVDEDLYQRRIHRVRYKFDHALTRQELVIEAKGRSHRVASVDVKSQDGEISLEVFEKRKKESIGTFSYSDFSQTLFSGQLGGRRVEIERHKRDQLFGGGPLGSIRLPYPITGEFTVRFDGEVVAEFAQRRPKGTKYPYELALEGQLDERAREDAMLTFQIFDLMKEFVASR